MTKYTLKAPMEIIFTEDGSIKTVSWFDESGQGYDWAWTDHPEFIEKVFQEVAVEGGDFDE